MRSGRGERTVRCSFRSIGSKSPHGSDKLHVVYSERHRKLIQCDDRWISAALLDAADILLAEARDFRKPLLRQALFLPDSLDVFPD